MNRLMILSLLGAFITFGAQAADQPAPKPLSHCESFSKYGIPQDQHKDAVTICRTAYEVRYDPEAKIHPIMLLVVLLEAMHLAAIKVCPKNNAAH
jgi:hypothetical protein